MFSWIWLLITLVIVCAMFIKIYQKLTCGICKSSTHMVGKVVIVTGGNCGLGYETAKDLAFRGARVILACRSADKGNEAVKKIVKETGNSDIHFRQLDLSSLESVRSFSESIHKTEKYLHVLINNAGAGGLGNYKTVDGLQVGMQVNYFAPFLLTYLLLDLLRDTAKATSENSRIVNVSSLAYKYGKLEFDNLNMEKNWSDFYVYANSKLCLNLMTLHLGEILIQHGITINALHPGVAATEVFRHFPSAIIRNIWSKSVDFLCKSPWEASQTSIYLAVAREVQQVTGKYFSDCEEAKRTKLSLDRKKAELLCKETEKLVQVKLPF